VTQPLDWAAGEHGLCMAYHDGMPTAGRADLERAMDSFDLA
jgi:hypothetical protein